MQIQYYKKSFPSTSDNPYHFEIVKLSMDQLGPQNLEKSVFSGD